MGSTLIEKIIEKNTGLSKVTPQNRMKTKQNCLILPIFTPKLQKIPGKFQIYYCFISND